jgi:hypothetical protein
MVHTPPPPLAHTRDLCACRVSSLPRASPVAARRRVHHNTPPTLLLPQYPAYAEGSAQPRCWQCTRVSEAM